jgi:hypothetical protein
MSYFFAFKRPHKAPSKMFGIFAHETLPERDSAENPYFLLADSFSFWAAALQTLWCFYHRLWNELAVLFLLSLAFSALEKQGLISLTQFFILGFLLSIFVGLEAPYWRQKKLLNQGFVSLGSVFGANKDDALRRILDTRISA